RAVMQRADKGHVPGSELEVSDFMHELVREEKHLAQRNILAKWNEANFVVVSDGHSATHQERRVPNAVRSGRILCDGTEDDVDAGAVGNGFDRFAIEIRRRV